MENKERSNEKVVFNGFVDWRWCDDTKLLFGLDGKEGRAEFECKFNADKSLTCVSTSYGKYRGWEFETLDWPSHIPTITLQSEEMVMSIGDTIDIYEDGHTTLTVEEG